MDREKDILKLLNDLSLLYTDLNRLIVQFDTLIAVDGIYLHEWQCPKREIHSLQRIGHDNKYLYINCLKQNAIYCYSFDGRFTKSFNYRAFGMEIVNNQFYLMNDLRMFIIDIQTNVLILNWDLPKENSVSVGGWYLKADQDKIYWTPFQYSHYVYLYKKIGKEIKKFGARKSSEKKGQFNSPYGITVNNKYLYVCDKWNHRVQALNKDTGKFIREWKSGKREFKYPRSILLDENLLYVGDNIGIQVFMKEDNQCIQLFGSSGSVRGAFDEVTGICFVKGKIYIVDCGNSRIQVWS